MPSPIDDCEILVHVDAPALAANDAGYRELAQAYLDFHPNTITRLPEHISYGAKDRRQPIPETAKVASLFHGASLLADRGGDLPSIHSQDFSYAEDRPLSEAETENGVHLLERERSLASEGGQQHLIDSQDLSFDEVIDNRESPRLRAVAEFDQLVIPSSLPELSSSQQSWCAPPSEIEDSYPIPNVVSHTSPSRILRQWTTPRPSITCTPEVTKDALPSQLAGYASSQRKQGLQNGLELLSGSSHRAHDAANVVFATPTSPTSTRKRARDLEDTEEEDNDITHVSASDSSQPARPVLPVRAGSEPVPPKRNKTAHGTSSLRNDLKRMTRSASDTTPRRHEIPSNSQEIWARSPPVGVSNVVPSDFISETLAKLTRQLSSRYRPQASRDIRPFERGDWLIDSTSWSNEKHKSFWEFLTPYLEGGLAGWGVWCRRDEARRYVRCFCWGHVVKQIYLLLYLVSDRHLKVTGAQWRDAGGTMVIRVPPLAKTV